MTVYLGEIETFPDARADKAQVVKILEECAEIFGAWQAYDRAGCAYGEARTHLLDECADAVQAIANLAAALGVHNFTLYVEECERRNRERGRYDRMGDKRQ